MTDVIVMVLGRCYCHICVCFYGRCYCQFYVENVEPHHVFQVIATSVMADVIA